MIEAQPPKALLLDMDGVLYHGTKVLPDALDFIHAIDKFPKLFITNNPIATPEEIVNLLYSMGFPQFAPSQVLTSAIATAKYLNQRKNNYRYYAVGAEGLDRALSQYGVADENFADFVVVGEGKGLDYQSLSQGVNLVLKQGAELISTNPDLTVDAHIDGKHRILPGGGALVAPFEAACARKAVVIGKPEPLLYKMALQLLGVKAADCIMIGDRADTDIAGAQRLGIATAMVRTGRLAPNDPWPAYIKPADWDVASLDELRQQWCSAWPQWFI